MWVVQIKLYISELLSAVHSAVFFFNDTATTEIYTLSLHDALPIYRSRAAGPCAAHSGRRRRIPTGNGCRKCRSEEHTSELQSRLHLVCRLLLEKKKDAFSTRPPTYFQACLHPRELSSVTPLCSRSR